MADVVAKIAEQIAHLDELIRMGDPLTWTREDQFLYINMDNARRERDRCLRREELYLKKQEREQSVDPSLFPQYDPSLYHLTFPLFEDVGNRQVTLLGRDDGIQRINGVAGIMPKQKFCPFS